MRRAYGHNDASACVTPWGIVRVVVARLCAVRRYTDARERAIGRTGETFALGSFGVRALRTSFALVLMRVITRMRPRSDASNTRSVTCRRLVAPSGAMAYHGRARARPRTPGACLHKVPRLMSPRGAMIYVLPHAIIHMPCPPSGVVSPRRGSQIHWGTNLDLKTLAEDSRDGNFFLSGRSSCERTGKAKIAFLGAKSRRMPRV